LEFVKKGVAVGRQPDLTGGGLVRTGISKKLNIASTASKSVTRGQQIAEKQGFTLLDEKIE